MSHSDYFDFSVEKTPAYIRQRRIKRLKKVCNFFWKIIYYLAWLSLFTFLAAELFIHWDVVMSVWQYTYDERAWTLPTLISLLIPLIGYLWSRKKDDA